MEGKSTFRLTFHVSHPSIDAQEIENMFDLPVKFSQSVGLPRKTRTGKPLSGTYKRTNVSFQIHENPINFENSSITCLMKEQIKSYNSSFLKNVRDTGGSCHFLIGIFSSDNIMFEFDTDLIDRLHAKAVGIKFDFYGGEE